MVEVEVKFAVADFQAIEDWLANRSARGPEILCEEDHYFRAPDRDFAVTDEALRLRRTAGANVLTYKGPKQDPQTKTRLEIECDLAPGDGPAEACVQLLRALRYGEVSVVRKQRRRYELEAEGFRLSYCLDEVDGIGRFVELEILAPPSQVARARDLLMQHAGALGLEASERRSYLELQLARQDSPGR